MRAGGFHPAASAVTSDLRSKASTLAAESITGFQQAHLRAPACHQPLPSFHPGRQLPHRGRNLSLCEIRDRAVARDGPRRRCPDNDRCRQCGVQDFFLFSSWTPIHCNNRKLRKDRITLVVMIFDFCFRQRRLLDNRPHDRASSHDRAGRNGRTSSALRRLSPRHDRPSWYTACPSHQRHRDV